MSLPPLVEYLGANRKRQKRITSQLHKSKIQLDEALAAPKTNTNEANPHAASVELEAVYGQIMIQVVGTMRSHLSSDDDKSKGSLKGKDKRSDSKEEEVNSMIKLSNEMSALDTQLKKYHQAKQKQKAAAVAGSAHAGKAPFSEHTYMNIRVQMEVVAWFTQQQSIMFPYLTRLVEGYLWQGDRARKKVRDKVVQIASATDGPDQRIGGFMAQHLHQFEGVISKVS